MAFGQQGGVGASNNVVTGVNVRRCKYGLITGYATNNTIEVKTDHIGDLTANAARLENSSGNSITLDIDRVEAGKNTLHLVNSSENVINVRRLNGHGARLLNLVSGTDNRVIVGRIAGFNGDLSTLVADSSGGTTNKVGYLLP